MVSEKQLCHGDIIFYCEVRGFLRFLFGTLGHLACGSRPLSFDRSNLDSYSIDTPTQRREKGLTRRYRLWMMLCSAFDNHLVAVSSGAILTHPEGEAPNLIYQ